MTYIIDMEQARQTMLRMQLEETTHYGKTHVAQYTPEYVFNLLKLRQDGIHETELHGFRVKLASLRYKVFRRSCVCVACGLVGTVMSLDRSDKKGPRAHFNLYGITESGRVVMLTKDHIVPKSKGGSNRLDNLQTMCETCNRKKADK